MTGLDEIMNRLKEDRAQELPHSIRLRMDDIYAGLDDVVQEKPDTGKKRSLLRRITVICAGTAAAGLLLIGSGFVSPVMAQALKQIPFLESVFNLAGDKGLQKASEAGYAVNANQSVTHNGVTIRLSEVVYDGSRLSFVLTKEMAGDGGNQGTANNWYEELVRSKGSSYVFIDFYVNNKLINSSMGYSSGGDKAPGSLLVHGLDSPGLNIPDQFELKLVMRFSNDGVPYEFTLPVKKTNDNNIVLTPGETKVFDHIHMKAAKLEITPVTTRLEMEITGEPGQDIKEIAEAIPDKYKVTGFINISYDIFDDKGSLQKNIGGSGTGEDDHYLYSSSYEPFESIPEFVTVKPYIFRGREKQYISELEFKIPVK
ncbi:DUF4179 domain-containing protein [Paenibacillus sp. VCA1]|uniref:DUF4179 domain-containing protein n=1 Tax=Paenibacillus sp. VCA1 TaxID=3039148 RepID=UPI002870C44B|nr:DUF4179 domain-containing protein [Paenibacillus sp. VCA1]MDR9854953.1 DUF4179 domain-containing protein [Paenibacillus sp. VCA1]